MQAKAQGAPHALLARLALKLLLTAGHCKEKGDVGVLGYVHDHDRVYKHAIHNGNSTHEQVQEFKNTGRKTVAQEMISQWASVSCSYLLLGLALNLLVTTCHICVLFSTTL